jgi:Na+-driven multidrug efflux pump
MLAFLPGLFIQSHIDIHRRFLNSIGKNSVPLISLFIGMVFHLFFNWYFVLYLEMGIIGTGIAGVLMNLIVFIIQFTYANLFIKELKDALKWPDRRSFQLKGLKAYMKIGTPSIIL